MSDKPFTTGHVNWSPDYKTPCIPPFTPVCTIACQTCGKTKPEDACECRGSLQRMMDVGKLLLDALLAQEEVAVVAAKIRQHESERLQSAQWTQAWQDEMDRLQDRKERLIREADALRTAALAATKD